MHVSNLEVCLFSSIEMSVSVTGFFYEFVSDQLGHGLPAQRIVSSLNDAATEAANCFSLSEIEDATRKFEKKIGSGGFGVVYYGKMKDGKEIAVKVLINNSYQGNREFSNEVAFPLIPFLFLFFSFFILSILDAQLSLFLCSMFVFPQFLSITIDGSHDSISCNDGHSLETAIELEGNKAYSLIW